MPQTLFKDITQAIQDLSPVTAAILLFSVATMISAVLATFVLLPL